MSIQPIGHDIEQIFYVFSLIKTFSWDQKSIVTLSYVYLWKYVSVD